MFSGIHVNREHMDKLGNDWYSQEQISFEGLEMFVFGGNIWQF